MPHRAKTLSAEGKTEAPKGSETALERKGNKHRDLHAAGNRGGAGMTLLGQGFPRQPGSTRHACQGRQGKRQGRASGRGRGAPQSCTPTRLPPEVRARPPPSTAWAGLAKPMLHWNSGGDPSCRTSSETRVGTRPCHWLEITNDGAGAWPDPALPLAGELLTAGRGGAGPESGLSIGWRLLTAGAGAWHPLGPGQGSRSGPNGRGGEGFGPRAKLYGMEEGLRSAAGRRGPASSGSCEMSWAGIKGSCWVR